MRSPLDIAKLSSKKELADPSCPHDITRPDAVRKPLCIRLCTRIRLRATQILTLIRTITFTLALIITHTHPRPRPSPSLTLTPALSPSLFVAPSPHPYLSYPDLPPPTPNLRELQAAGAATSGRGPNARLRAGACCLLKVRADVMGTSPTFW